MKILNKLLSDISPKKYFLVSFLILACAIIDTFIVSSLATLIGIPVLASTYTAVNTIIVLLFGCCIFIPFPKTLKWSIINLLLLVLSVGIIASTTIVALPTLLIAVLATIAAYAILFVLSKKIKTDTKILTGFLALLTLLSIILNLIFTTPFFSMLFCITFLTFLFVLTFNEFRSMNKYIVENINNSKKEILIHILQAIIKTLYVGFFIIIYFIVK